MKNKLLEKYFDYIEAYRKVVVEDGSVEDATKLSQVDSDVTSLLGHPRVIAFKNGLLAWQNNPKEIAQEIIKDNPELFQKFVDGEDKVINILLGKGLKLHPGCMPDKLKEELLKLDIKKCVICHKETTNKRTCSRKCFEQEEWNDHNLESAGLKYDRETDSWG